MSKLNEAIQQIHQLSTVSLEDKWINQIHPLAKVVVTGAYILTVVSFQKYNIVGLAGMSIYLIVTIIWGGISIRQCLRQIRSILLLVGLVGIANPFFDRRVLGQLGEIVITGGRFLGELDPI